MITVSSLEVHEFSLPLRVPLQTSWGRVEQRAGLYLHARASNGVESLAEISPLEGFSRESLDEARNSFTKLKPLIHGVPINSRWDETASQISTMRNKLTVLPSVAWGVQTLLLDLSAQTQEVSLAEYVRPGAITSIPVNGLLAGSGKELLARFEEKRAHGYTCYKVKYLAQEWTRQLAAIQEIQRQFPEEIRFRIDCNKSLSLDQAKHLCDSLHGIELEYLEEPLAKVSQESLAELKEHSGYAIALDESAQLPSAQKNLFSKEFCDLVVIKPMLFGGFIASLEMLEKLEQANIDFVVTSTLEGPVGILAGLQFACIAFSKTRSKPRACGFDTLSLFSETFLNNRLAVHNGIIQLPDAYGLGLDESERKSLLAKT